MAYRLAKSLVELRSQVNDRWPNRSKNSDGWIGDTSHSARKSDHNPDHRGIVHAIDITHDPKNGFDSYKFADAMLADQDPRLSYIISNGRIGSGPSGTKPGVWRKYTGANKHDHHVHFSVLAKRADDDSPWDILDTNKIPNKPVKSAPAALPVLRLGSKGDDVVKLQRLLKVEDDGDFGKKTKAAVMAFQTKSKLTADGIAGPQTLVKLGWS